MPQSIIFILFLFFSIKSNADEDVSRAAELYCPSSTCKNGTIHVSYPFWRLDDTSPTAPNPQMCGYPGFGINCSNPDPNYPLLYLSNHTFLVNNINYTDSLIVLVDADVTTNKDCPITHHNITFPERSPLVYSTGDVNLTFYLNCTNHFADAYPIDCLSSEHFTSYLHVGAAAAGRYRSDWFRSCEEEVETAVMKTGEIVDDEGWWVRNVGGAMNNGFVLNWRNLEECSLCENSKGLCGQNEVSGEFLCFCGSGSVTQDYCRLFQGIGGAALCLTVICTILFAYHRRERRYPSGNELHCQGSGNCTICNGGIFKKSLQRRNLEVFMEQYRSLAPTIYRYSDIKKMTSSFKHKLGQGGYGEVYKGKLYDDRLVAVKILNSTKGDGEEFINEVVSIGQTSHVNVVNLLGFCYHGIKRALVYEFMPNGSLERYIHGDNTHLRWDKLYEIAIGIARGLEYLHKGCNTRILHFDIKPHNILLDQDFCPKISDFGLAKLCTNKESNVSMLGVRGTIGYIAPEVVSRNFGSVSHKSDVYSYGMMILEMVGGRKNVNDNVSRSSEINFPHWAYQRLLVDEDLKLQGVRTEEEEEIAKKMILIGFWCIQTDPSDRPSMNKVIEMLIGSLEKLEIPPKPFLYSSSQSQSESSEGISPVISPTLLLRSSSSPSFNISMNIDD
ncbi:PREDICTED: LEAF RUST 10 DISEASE-RESISTANCE LOCUS RECEPTOR-LIKE PROTEIN KINASE-like 2.1 isoform X2 [Ipomoea nil]|uniref:LEAF RUST 10 DISEASE-RESISTANCE LOCUS RECEPTOR-LIKE PROTEIN KINASE-like 2.1 isoform X2 n=1 Tax=Ipomoea nil TaxID=35883 RepID=UPI000901385F|nr:PREDICTED: LEAF RUST 10 DISEASE-RESISTANCE LOCUS RECEPTOR-LIKE PROTEIN KINASE-like 2.1 isoform X2 [Ipomoea nil]